MAAVTTQECFSDDWARTNPDLVVYLPKEPSYNYESTDVILVDYTPNGDLLAVFTLAGSTQGDYTIVHSRSQDGGVNWTQPGAVARSGPVPGQRSAWGYPLISATDQRHGTHLLLLQQGDWEGWGGDRLQLLGRRRIHLDR